MAATNVTFMVLDAQRVSVSGFHPVRTWFLRSGQVLQGSDSDLNSASRRRKHTAARAVSPAAYQRFDPALDSGKLTVSVSGRQQTTIPETYRIAFRPQTHITPQTPPFFLFQRGM